jgi:hypothetical protein
LAATGHLNFFSFYGTSHRVAILFCDLMIVFISADVRTFAFKSRVLPTRLDAPRTAGVSRPWSSIAAT